MLNTRERTEEDRTGDNDEHQVQIYSFSPCLPTQLPPPPPPPPKTASRMPVPYHIPAAVKL